jgi:hypothetical protein
MDEGRVDPRLRLEPRLLRNRPGTVLDVVERVRLARGGVEELDARR